MRVHLWAAVLPASCIAAINPALAGTCETYVGQKVTPKTFDEVAGPFAAAKPKGEYETTAAYEARMAALAPQSPVIVGTVRRDEGKTGSIRYDADAQALSVPAWAFQGKEGFDPILGFVGTSASDLMTRANINAVVYSRWVPLGSHPAQNAFGAKARVQELKYVAKVIFDGNSTDTRKDLFADRFEEAGRIPMSPMEAKRLKPLLKLAYVIRPQAPYFVNSRYTHTASIDNPRETKFEASVLLADIQCALVIDDKGTVRGSFPTN